MLLNDSRKKDPYVEDELKRIAATSDAPIYAISLVPDAPITPPLILLTAQTGGLSLNPTRSSKQPSPFETRTC